MRIDLAQLTTGPNQSPPFEDVNLYLTDAALRDAVEREGASPANRELTTLGATSGSARGFEIGRLANENPPKLKRHDQKGFPLDRVEFHQSYHDAMTMSFLGRAPLQSLGPSARAREHAARGPACRPSGWPLHDDPDGSRPAVPDHDDECRGIDTAATA